MTTPAQPDVSVQALINAIVIPHLDNFQSLLKAGVPVNQPNEEGRLPLSFVVVQGVETMLDALLEHGANPTQKDVTGLHAIDLANVLYGTPSHPIVAKLTAAVSKASS